MWGREKKKLQRKSGGDTAAIMLVSAAVAQLQTADS
jgi:hypothetical protein